MDFEALEAVGLFILWAVQFFVPHWREEITVVYAVWAGIETVRLLINFKKRNAFSAAASLFRAHTLKGS
jgi:hypothetical protein